MSGAPRHLLVVEDEPGTLTTVTLLLEMAGFRVTQAANGRRALECLANELPDLVLTDYMMPHLDGLGLIQAIRADERCRHLPVILTSAALPAGVDGNAVADGFIGKPYHIETLIGLIESLLGRSSQPS